MMKSRWVAGAALLGACLVVPAARAENAPPAPPGTAAAPPGTAPGTTAGTAAAAPPVPLPGVLTVMVFPFDNVPGAGGPALGQALADTVQQGMDRSKVYSTAKFSKTSLLVQRAATESPGIMNPDIAGVIDPVKGSVDPTRAMKIAQRTGMQALLLGSIEEYTYDKAANKVTMVATAQILNSQTGEPLRTAGVTGTATGTAGTDESVVAQAAATDVASRLLAGLAVPPPPPPPRGHKGPRRPPPSQEEEGSRHHFPGWIPAGVLLGILVGAVR
jgi:hypothetical protein